MFFVDYILPILSFLIATLSAILAFKANRKSQEANNLAEKANKISEEANILSKRTNEIAEKSLYAQIAPEIKLTKLGLDPTKVKVYGGDNITWDGKDNIPDKIYKTILNTVRTNSIVIIDDKKYLLINLCYKDTAKDDIGLVVDAFYFEMEFTKNQIDELMILKAYSLLDSETPFGIDVKINTHIDVQTSTITIPIAYACPANRESSLNLGSIAKMAKETTEKIDLIKTPSKAKQIIYFLETAYLIKCRTFNNHEFLFSLYMKKDNVSGELETLSQCGSDELYNEKYKKAKENAHKEIQQLAETQ